MANRKLKLYAKAHDVCLWEIAAFLRISEPTFTRKLRSELSSDEFSKIKFAIDQISRQKESDV